MKTTEEYLFPHRHRVGAALYLTQVYIYSQEGNKELKDVLSAMNLKEEEEQVLRSMADTLKFRCCDQSECKAEEAVEDIKKILRVASMSTNRKQFESLLKFAEAQVRVVEYESDNLRYDFCQAVAYSLITDAFDAEKDEHSQFHRKDFIREKIIERWGAPVERRVQGKLVARDGSRLLPDITRAYETGELFQLLYGTGDKNSSFHSEEEWADTITIKEEQ
jgi:hypothetical protein